MSSMSSSPTAGLALRDDRFAGSCRSAPVGPTAFADPAASAAAAAAPGPHRGLTPNSTTETPASTMPGPDHRAEHQPGRPGHDRVADVPHQPQRPGQPGAAGSRDQATARSPAAAPRRRQSSALSTRPTTLSVSAQRLPGRGVDAVHPTSLRGRGAGEDGARCARSPTPASPTTTARRPRRSPPRCAAYDADPDRRHAATLAVLQRARLLVPVVAVLGEVEHDEQGLAHDKTSDMATVLMTGRDGRSALLAFTGHRGAAPVEPRGAAGAGAGGQGRRGRRPGRRGTRCSWTSPGRCCSWWRPTTWASCRAASWSRSARARTEVSGRYGWVTPGR